MTLGRTTAPAAGGTKELVPGLSRLSDRAFVAALSALLFVLAAWPLATVASPPFQDLPNHYATLTVIEHPTLYPEFAFNGFVKTNSAFFLFLHVVSPLLGLHLTAKLFTALVLGLNAWTFVTVAYRETERRDATLFAAFLAAPLVHHWFVSAGMLDFALSVPLGVWILLLANAQLRKPTANRAARIFLLGILTWYAHSMSLLIAGLLVTVTLFGKDTVGRRRAFFRDALLPLAPAGALVATSILEQMRSVASDPWASPVKYRSFPVTWELVYNFWAETYFGFTKLSLLSIVPCVVLAALGLRHMRRGFGVFSLPSIVVLLVFASFTPYVLDNWFHVNSRFFLFVFVAFLVRVTEPSRKALWVVALSSLSVSIGNGIDYVRLAKEQAELDTAIPKVAEGARLLPLMFRQKNTSENTRNMIHAWGDFVVAKHTSAPLLFAHSRSFPVTYTSAPPSRFNHLILESTAARLRSPSEFCDMVKERRSFVLVDCRATYDALWKEFWSDALPRFDHVLMWDASEEALANLPSRYRLVHQEGRSRLYVRSD